MKALCDANIEVLNQLETLIEHCTPIYSDKLGSRRSGIGQHVRHVLDHYDAFQTGLSKRCIDYNHRRRLNPVEHDSQLALQEIAKLKSWLEKHPIRAEAIDVISEIKVSVTHHQRLSSHTQREMLYLINHAIHHMAYAALLAQQMQIHLPQDIGIAPGTASYDRQQTQETDNA